MSHAISLNARGRSGLKYVNSPSDVYSTIPAVVRASAERLLGPAVPLLVRVRVPAALAAGGHVPAQRLRRLRQHVAQQLVAGDDRRLQVHVRRAGRADGADQLLPADVRLVLAARRAARGAPHHLPAAGGLGREGRGAQPTAGHHVLAVRRQVHGPLHPGGVSLVHDGEAGGGERLHQGVYRGPVTGWTCGGVVLRRRAAGSELTGDGLHMQASAALHRQLEARAMEPS